MYLTLRQLQYFEAIAVTGSITQAATQLRVSATAISLQIRLLEERSGHMLLERHSRGVRVTPVGKDLLMKSRRILNLVSETEHELAAHVETMPKVRIGMPPRAMRTLGYDCLTARTTRKISYEVSLRELHAVDLLSRLEEGEINLAVGFGLKPKHDIHIVEVLRERLALIVPRSFETRGQSVTLPEALATRLLMYSQDSVLWDEVARVAREHKLKLPEPTIIGSMDVIVHLIADGRGTTIAPRGVVEAELARGELREVAIEGEPMCRRMCIAVKSADLANASIAGLIEELCNLARTRHLNQGSVYAIGG